VHITFSIPYETKFGEVLNISGSIPELGFWNPKFSKKLTWAEGNTWHTSVAVNPKEVPFEYKYFISTDSETNPKWESCPNRTTLPSKRGGRVQISDVWEKTEAQTSQQ
jgi:hypothetical protein